MRLWGRWWLGLVAVALAAAVSGPAGSALGAGAPPVRASAQAVTVLVPGAPAEGSTPRDGVRPGLGARRLPLSEEARRGSQGRLGEGDRRQADRREPDRGGRLRSSAASGSWAARCGHAGSWSRPRSRHRRRPPAAACRGWWCSAATCTPRRAPRSSWPAGAHSTCSPRPRATPAGSAAAAIAGLRLTLLQDHDGLPAGTVIELGAARAAITAAAPPPPPPPGGTGPTTPTAPQRTLGTTLRPRPVRPTAPTAPPWRRPSGHASGRPRRHRPAHHPPPQAAHALIAAAAGGRARVIAAALDQVGWPYIWGGDSRTDGGFDCSGLVDYAYGRAGMTLPGRPTAAVLWRMSMPVGRARLQPGDLAFLYSRNRAPYHVALYVGDGLVVVAPHTGADVEIEPLSAITWDGYGRLLSGGRGDGLARSVAAAARRFAHPGQGAAAPAGRSPRGRRHRRAAGAAPRPAAEPHRSRHSDRDRGRAAAPRPPGEREGAAGRGRRPGARVRAPAPACRRLPRVGTHPRDSLVRRLSGDRPDRVG